MSLNWNWEDKMGDCIMDGYENGEPAKLEGNIYDCNGLYVCLFEFTQDGKDMYNMADFAVDETHFKNCLGLTKECKGNNKNYVYEYRLNMAHKNAQKMAKCLMQAQAKGKWKGKLVTYFDNNKGE